MNPLIINSKNIIQHPWVLDFLESQSQRGIYFWRATSLFSYQGHEFRFENKVFARQRKIPRQGYAYEMMAATWFERNENRALWRIDCTISRGKTGAFQVRNQKRIVKITDEPGAEKEYQISAHAQHLHVKAPVDGYLVMKEMPGKVLYKFINSPSLTRAEKLELSRALARALKEQVLDNQLIHQDLHQDNILVRREEEKLIVSIIDFAQAQLVTEDNLELFNQSPTLFLMRILNELWFPAENSPTLINKLLHSKPTSLLSVIQTLDEVVLAPSIETQKPLDNLLAYCKELAFTHVDLAQTLKDKLRTAANQSNPKNVEPLRQAVSQCKTLLDEQLPEHHFSIWVFDSNPEKQKAFNNIFDYFQLLEEKSNKLIANKHHQEGQKLRVLIHTLTEQTFNAAYQPPQERREKLVNCGKECKKLLQENEQLINKYTGSHWMYEMISFFFSLVIPYPVLTSVNYLRKNNLVFFNHSESLSEIEKLENDFKRCGQQPNF